MWVTRTESDWSQRSDEDFEFFMEFGIDPLYPAGTGTSLETHEVYNSIRLKFRPPKDDPVTWARRHSEARQRLELMGFKLNPEFNNYVCNDGDCNAG